MSTDLLKSLDELDDAELEALADHVLTTEFFDELDAATAAAKDVRAAVAADPDRNTWTREDVVSVLNSAEYQRRLVHVLVSFAAKNTDRIVTRLKSAGCAYCDDWKYADQDFGIPTDRELTEEEITAVDDRVKDAIRAHIQTCPAHPMRELERQLSEARV